jgi:iron complex transport system substrate-binding protein
MRCGTIEYSMRIVSLLASGTEIVCALGAGEWLVGRSHECDNPPWVRSLPQCSEPAFDVSVSSGEIDREVRRRLRSGEPLYIIHDDLIRALEPDIIITQSHCEVCAVTPGDVKRNGKAGIQPMMATLSASTLEEILGSVQYVADVLSAAVEGGLQPPLKKKTGFSLASQAEAYATILPNPTARNVETSEPGLKPRLQAAACSTLSELRGRLDRVRQRIATRPRPTVVVLEWADPIFCIGNWGPELLEIAGGKPLLGNPGQLSMSIAAEQLREADPDVLIIAPCGFNLERAWGEQAALERLPWWGDLKAVRSGRVAFADGNLYFNRAGTTIARTGEILAEILHGVETNGLTEGVCWRWYTESRLRVV